MSTAQLAATLTYTPPGGGVNSATATLSVNSPYTALSAGILDIPDATAMNTAFAIPFGSVAEAIMLIVVNTNNQDMTMNLAGNTMPTYLYQQPPGGQLIIAHPVAAAANGLTEAETLTAAAQVGDGTMTYFVFGT